MNFPANYLHTFVAVPLFIVFALSSIRSYSRTKNRITLYLGITVGCYVFTLFCLGFPALFTQDPRILTAGMLAGAIFELLAGITMWALVARLYAPKSDFIRGSIISLGVVIALVTGYLAFRDLLATPVTLVQSGSFQILYSPVTSQYTTALALQYASTLFIAIAFWRQSGSVSTMRDKVRLRVLSIMFAVVFIVLGLLPFSSPGGNGVLSIAQSIQLAVGISLLGVFMAITFFIRPDKKVSN